MKKNRGFAAVVPLLVLAIGLLVAIFLVGRQTFFKPRASETPPTGSPWGNAVAFPAGGQAATASAILLTNNFTVEAWVYPRSPRPQENNFIFEEKNSFQYYLNFWTSGNRIFASLYDKTNSRLLSSGPESLTPDVWHHFALTYQQVPNVSQGISLYLDGKLVSTAPWGNGFQFDSAPNMHIGALVGPQFSQPVNGFYGNIDELRISNIVRYQQNFVPQLAPFTTDVNTLALYHFDKLICNVNGICFTPDSTNRQNNAWLIGNVQFIPSTVPYTSPTTHRACVNNACAVVPGVDTDKCKSDVDCVPVNHQPVAKFLTGSLSNMREPLTVRFQNASTDPDNDPMTYLWDFGDGSKSTDTSPSHIFKVTKPGLDKQAFTITLTATDSHGAIGTANTTITVLANHLPVAKFSWAPYQSCKFGPCVIDTYKIVFTNTSADPDNDPLTYLWNFGDGQTSTDKNPTHAYSKTTTRQKTYQVTLTVWDDHEGQGQKTSSITVGP